MNVRQTLKTLLRPTGIVLGLIVSLCMVNAQTSTVYAYCEMKNGVDNHDRAQCWYDNYQTLKDTGKTRGLSEDQYFKIIDNCVNSNGGPNGKSNYYAKCGNSAYSCVQWTTELDRCSNGNYVSAINDCNDGKLTSNTGCGPIDDANDHFKDDQAKAIQDKATSTCTLNKGTQSADLAACKNLVYGVAEACKSYRDRFGYIADTNGYTKCMQENLARQTPDETACKARGGTWLANDAGGVAKGCHVYTDLTSKEACDAGKGEFVNTGQKNSAGQDVWTCKKPGASNNNPNGTPGNVDNSTVNAGTQTKDEGTCGTHGTNKTATRTVLIKTGNVDGCSGSGISLIGGLLKFVLTTLTIGIGIVAVGGIAYGAVLYSSARGNSGQVQQAIGIIRNVVIGLLMYIFMISILNFLVPGGVIG